MTISCHGLGVAGTRAIAVGKAFLINRGPIDLFPRRIAEHLVPEEHRRLEQALQAARTALKNVRNQLPRSTSVNVAEFLDTHLLMLEDSALLDAVRALIANELWGAEWALQIQKDSLVKVFDEMEDPYLRTRRDDVEHVVSQIQDYLRGPEGRPDHAGEDFSGCVIIADDITPADAILLRHQGAAAFVTEFGGPMSHTAILARSLNVPAVVGVHDVTNYVHHGETIVVDGETGTVLTDVEDAVLDFYRERLRAIDAHRQQLRRLINEPSRSIDGIEVKLLANLELPEDIAATKANHPAGVGLYRTEFLYMNRVDLPDEEEHLETYRSVIEGLDGIPITIRTLDLGVDKPADITGNASPPPSNPALGLRAIRLCLKEPELFRPQLRAIIRASAFGPVRLMIPMISSTKELDTVIALIDKVKAELRDDGFDFAEDIPLGAMIEVPAAALTAEAMARRLDFLSIGTNDLIQYTFAIDRVDDAVSHLYDPANPAILRLIQMTIDAGLKLGKPVSMCGEMAGDTKFTRLLLGMGLREFSMQPGSLLEVKEIIRGSDIAALRLKTEKLFQQLDQLEGSQVLEAMNQ